jgi:hypothetical protein
MLRECSKGEPLCVRFDFQFGKLLGESALRWIRKEGDILEIGKDLGSEEGEILSL